MNTDALAASVCAVQSVREILEEHCAEVYARDVMLAVYVLGAVERDLMTVWEEVEAGQCPACALPA